MTDVKELFVIYFEGKPYNDRTYHRLSNVSGALTHFLYQENLPWKVRARNGRVLTKADFVIKRFIEDREWVIQFTKEA